MKHISFVAFLFLLMICACSNKAFTQQLLPCGTDHIDTAALRKAAIYETQHNFRIRSATPVLFRVYFHILSYDDGTNATTDQAGIVSEFNNLTADYSADNICFLNAGIDYIYSSSLDTNYNVSSGQGPFNPFLVANCINVFYVGKIKGNNTACATGCGFGGYTFGIPGTVSLIAKGNIGLARTISHEVGHCMGLLHTFEPANGQEDIDGSNSATTADLVTDTPADPYGYGVGCFATTANKCVYTGNCKDPKGRSDFSPPYTNIMAYWGVANGGACYPNLSFTGGQFARADSYIATADNLKACVSQADVTIGYPLLIVSSGFYINSAVNTLSTVGTVIFSGNAQVTLGGAVIKLEPGFRATPTNGGLTLIRVKQCN